MRTGKPLVIGTKMLLSLFLGWVGLLVTAFSLGLRLS